MLADPDLDAVIDRDRRPVPRPRRAGGDRRRASTCWSRSRSGAVDRRVRAAAATRCGRAGSCCRSGRCGGSTRGSRSRAIRPRGDRRADRVEGVVLRLGLPLPMTDTLQPLASGQRGRAQAGGRSRRPTGGATTCSATAAICRHGALSRRPGDRQRQGRSGRARRRALLVRRRRVRGRLDRASRPDDVGPDGLARGLPRLRRARQRDRPRASCPGTSARARSSASRPRDRQYHRPLGEDAQRLAAPDRGVRRHDPRRRAAGRRQTSMTGSPRCG